MARKKRARIDTSATQDQGLKGSLGDLLRRAGLQGAAGSDPPDAPRDPPIAAPSIDPVAGSLLALCGRLDVRRERKGRRGKEVTLVDGLEPLSPEARESLARGLRRKLGCGAAFEGDRLVLQGDQRERAVPLLEADGAKKVRIR